MHVIQIMWNRFGFTSVYSFFGKPKSGLEMSLLWARICFESVRLPGRMVNHNFSHHVSFNRSKPEGSHMKIVQTVNSLDKLCEPLTHLPS